jgi:hypothetical protein
MGASGTWAETVTHRTPAVWMSRDVVMLSSHVQVTLPLPRCA